MKISSASHLLKNFFEIVPKSAFGRCIVWETKNKKVSGCTLRRIYFVYIQRQTRKLLYTEWESNWLKSLSFISYLLVERFFIAAEGIDLKGGLIMLSEMKDVIRSNLFRVISFLFFAAVLLRLMLLSDPSITSSQANHPLMVNF